MDVSTYLQWSLFATLASFLVMVAAFIFQWGFRFRFVGITSFLTVLSIGLFGLGLGLFDRSAVEGSVAFSRVYDNGANQIVITVPSSITEAELDATLQQAAKQYFSLGRISTDGQASMVVRARTLIHPEVGVSEPLYLGDIRRTLGQVDNAEMKVTVNQSVLGTLQRYRADS